MKSERFACKFQKLMWIPYVLLAALLALVIGFGILNPDSYGELRSVWSLKKTVIMLTAGIGLFCVLLGLFLFWTGKLKAKTKVALLAALSALCFLLQLFLLLRYPVQIWWDNTSVLTSAISVITKDKSCFDEIYFNQVGHQNCFLLLTVILVAIARLFGIPAAYYTVYFSLIDMVAVDLAALFTLLTVKKIKGTDAACRLWIFILLCPGMYLWAAYYYTTNLSLFFISLFFFLAAKAWEKEKSVLFYLLFGVFTAFGMQLRATMMILALATLIYALFSPMKKPLKALLFTAAGLAAMLAVLKLSYNMMNPDYSKDARFPVTHWLMMAAQGNGEYNDEDLAYTSSFPTAEEKAEATRQEYFKRLEDLGPAGVFGLVIRKTTHNWAYGNHSYYPLFHRYDRLSDILWEPDRQGAFYVEQVYNLTLLILTLAGVVAAMGTLIKNRKDMAFRISFDGLLHIGLTGGFFFYMLWETFPYYSVGFLTVLFYLSAEGLGLLQKAFDNGAGKGAKSPSHRMWFNAATGAFILAAAVLIAFVFSKSSWPVTAKPVVTQKKLDRMLSLEGAKKAEQTFVASRSFDTISFWIGKERLDDEAGGIYDITIKGESSGTVFSCRYDSRSMTRVDEFTKSFPEVVITKPERFTVTVEVAGDDGGNPLQLGGYDLPVEAYMYGEFSLDGKVSTAEMFFTVTSGGPDSVIRLYE